MKKLVFFGVVAAALVAVWWFVGKKLRAKLEDVAASKASEGGPKPKLKAAVNPNEMPDAVALDGNPRRSGLVAAGAAKNHPVKSSMTLRGLLGVLDRVEGPESFDKVRLAQHRSILDPAPRRAPVGVPKMRLEDFAFSFREARSTVLPTIQIGGQDVHDDVGVKFGHAAAAVESKKDV